MRKLFILIALAAVAAVSCDEFEPAFTKYDSYKPEKLYKETYFSDTLGLDRITISDLKARYEAKNTPIKFQASDNLYVKGQVVSSDSTGNFYKSIFIQDETSGIEVKLGKYNLYNEYKMGQWVYVKMEDLSVGAYYGSIQIGFEDESGSYETSYMEVQRFIDNHVFRGDRAARVQPKVLTAADLKNGAKARCCGTYVTLENLVYAKEIFCLVYKNPNLPSELRDKNHAWERIFLSDQTWGVTTWAMSEDKFEEYLNSGVWDTATQAAIESGETHKKTVAEMRANKEIIPGAYTVSQYFKFGSYNIGVRTSGYAKFNDLEIDADILDASRKVTMTGIITYYSSSSEFQFTVSAPADIK